MDESLIWAMVVGKRWFDSGGRLGLELESEHGLRKQVWAWKARFSSSPHRQHMSFSVETFYGISHWP